MLTMLPMTAFGSDTSTPPGGRVCGHVHDENCGYIENVGSAPCSHQNVDGAYSCDPVLNTGNRAGYVCDHSDGCGYIEAAAGAGCTHFCELCETPSYQMVVSLFEALPPADRITEETTQQQLDELTAQINTALDALDALSDEDYGKFNAEHLALLTAAAELQAVILGTAPTMLADTVPMMDTANRRIYANGVPLILAAGASAAAYTVIYLDNNGNGEIDPGTDTIWAGSGMNNTAAGNNLASYTIYGGTQTDAFSGNTSITMLGGKIAYLYGGSRTGDITGNTNVTAAGGTISSTVYGGSWTGKITGGTNVTVSGAAIGSTVYGGSYNGEITKDAKVTISSGTVPTVYGGGSLEQAIVTGNTYIVISGGRIGEESDASGRVYGGGWYGAVKGSSHVSVTGGTVKATIYGGGNGSNSNAAPVEKDSNITITGGEVLYNVYGGGRIANSDVKGTRTVTVGGGAKVGSPHELYAYGIVINGAGTTNGVDRFVIDPNLTGTVYAALFNNIAAGTVIATGAAAGDLAKIKLVGSGAADKEACFDSTESTIKVAAAETAPAITTSSLPNGTVGTTYRQTLTADGGTPITWSVENGGSLPAGLSLNSSTGAITGVPTAAGISTFTVKAANAKGSDTKELSITIAPAPRAPEITTTSLPDGIVRTAYNQTLTADGSSRIIWSVENGSVLPAGLTLDGNTGAITGTPTATGTFTFVVKATNARGSDTKEVSIIIKAASPVPEEQFTGLNVGGTYYFDLSGAGLVEPVNAGYASGEDSYPGLPDTTLKYVPFTYAGTVNAYNLDSASNGHGGASSQATPSNHSLFIADYNVTTTASWDDLNQAGLIFGKGYTSGGVSYTLRAPSVGSQPTTTDLFGFGNIVNLPDSNEWDRILDKGVSILHWENMYTWGQDTQSSWDDGRMLRSSDSVRGFLLYNYTNRYVFYGFRPVLALPGNLNADALRTVTLDLNGKSFNGSNALLLAVGKGSGFTAPGKPSAIGDTFYGWNTTADGSGTYYAAAANIPDAVVTLYAQWEAPTTYTVTFNADGGTVTPSTAQTDANGKLASLPTPTRSGSYRFDGWYTAVTGGDLVTTNTVFNSNTTIYARWTYTGGSGGSGGSSNITTSTTTNPDGSTTTTTTNKTTGTVTETTKAKDGTETVVETKKDGSKKETVTTPDGTKTGTATTAQGDMTYTEQRTDGTKISADIPKSGEATATVHLSSNTTAPVVASFPVIDGTVVLRVLPNGTEEPVAYSLVEDGRVYVRLDGDAKLRVETRQGLFDDMDGHWAEEYADFTGARQLFQGTAPHIFNPEQPMTRAMLATVLYSMVGTPAAGESPFSDVDNGAWYADGVAWAAENGIVCGTGNGLFSAGRSITRQELAVMLWNYAKYEGIDVSVGEDTNILSFSDIDKAGEWAIPALQWVCGADIIQGNPDGTLNPAGWATRAQVSVMMERFVVAAVK